MTWADWKKWCLVALVSIATLAVAFVSSAYTGGLSEVIEQFHTSELIVTLGVSLFVLGFAIGPLMWAPMSEIFGRQILFIGTYAALTAFNAGAAGAKNITTLLLMRFFAGSFGSSPLTVSHKVSSTTANIFSDFHRTMVGSSQTCLTPISVVWL
jgi:MFS family permease